MRPEQLARLGGLLEQARAVREEAGLGRVLQAAAEAVADLLGFGGVVVNLHRRRWDDFEVTTAVGSPELRAALLGTSSSWADWSELLDERFARGGAFHVPAGAIDWSGHVAPTFVPAGTRLAAEDAWHPDEALFVVLRGSEGQTLGILSVDEPASGRRPSDAELDLLVAVAAAAALAVEAAHAAMRDRRHRRALEELLDVSSELARVEDPEGVGRVVAAAVHAALGFGKVTVCVVAGDEVRRVAAAGVALDDLATVRSIASARLAAELFAPRFERHGAYLLESADLEALLPGHTRYRSTCDGRGPHAWRGHTLVVPFRSADDDLVGFCWAADPADGLLPSPETLAALRTVANQAAKALDAVVRAQALRAAEARNAAVLASALDGFITLSADGRVLALNAAAERTLGLRAEDVRGRSAAVLLPERHHPHLAEVLRGELVGQRIELHALRADGAEVPVELGLARAEVAGEPVFAACVRDITARLAAERALRDERDRAQRLLDVAEALILVLDAQGRIALANRKCAQVLGVAEDELVGHDWFGFVPGEQRACRRDTFARLLAGRLPLGQHLETPLVTATGETRDIAWRDTVLREPDGSVTGTLSSGHDVTEQRAAERRIAHLAFHDPLTELANRAHVEARLGHALHDARGEGRAVALLYVDLDDFKLVNDSMGHAAGDQLLRAVAERLRSVRREGDLLARHGGDEFLLVLEGLAPAEARPAAERAAARIIEALAEPLDLAGAEVWVGASVGISLFPHDAGSAEELLKNADAAMYQAKAAGRNRHALFELGAGGQGRRVSLTAELRRALAREELELHFQPILRLAPRSLHAVEALLRWRRPDGKLIGPGEFIPVAEETGLIEPIGEWVIRAVCAQAAKWRALGLDPIVGFNLSARQLLRQDLASVVAQAAAECRLPPTQLTAEITETALMRHHDQAAATLRALADLGVTLAIDDFGAAYSSLSRLREMPVQVLKIDRSFLADVPGDPAAAQIVEAVLALARGLKLVAVAEGIERSDQLEFLLAHGCPLGQGYGLGRPLPAAATTELLLGGSRALAA